MPIIVCFLPGYSYTDEEIQEIQAAADNACQEVSALVSEGADDYEQGESSLYLSDRYCRISGI